MVTSTGKIYNAEYGAPPKFRSNNGKKKRDYFLKKSGGYYACSDLDENGSEIEFLANWMWDMEMTDAEREAVHQNNDGDGPVLTPYLRLGTKPPFPLEQFVVLDLGSGAKMNITKEMMWVPAGRGFRYGMKGSLVKVNVLSKASYDKQEFNSFPINRSALNYHKQQGINERLLKINEEFIKGVNRF